MTLTFNCHVVAIRMLCLSSQDTSTHGHTTSSLIVEHHPHSSITTLSDSVDLEQSDSVDLEHKKSTLNVFAVMSVMTVLIVLTMLTVLIVLTVLTVLIDCVKCV